MTDHATIMLKGHLSIFTNGETGQSISRKIGNVIVETPQKLGDVISNLETRYHLVLSRDSILILVNGIEANALDDLNTIIKADDEIAIVPMFHGG